MTTIKNNKSITVPSNDWYYTWFNNYIRIVPISEFNWEFLTHYLPFYIIILYKDLIGPPTTNKDPYHNCADAENDYDTCDKLTNTYGERDESNDDSDYSEEDDYTDVDIYSCNTNLINTNNYATWYWNNATQKMPIDFIISNMHFGWDLYYVTERAPIEFIINNFNFEWNYTSDKLAYLMPVQFIIQNKDKYWNWSILFHRSDMDKEFVFINLVEHMSDTSWGIISDYIKFDYIISHPEIKWNYYKLSSYPTISSEYILQNSELGWDWHALSINLSISLSFILRTLDILPWEIESVCDRSDITINFIIKNKLFDWNIVNNTDIQINDILRTKILLKSIMEKGKHIEYREEFTLEFIFDNLYLLPYFDFDISSISYSRRTLFRQKSLEESFKDSIQSYEEDLKLSDIIRSCIYKSTAQVIECEGENSLSFIEMHPMPWWDSLEIISFYVNNILLLNQIYDFNSNPSILVDYIFNLVNKDVTSNIGGCTNPIVYCNYSFTSRHEIEKCIWHNISTRKDITTHFFDKHSTYHWNIIQIYKNLSISIDYLISNYKKYARPHNKLNIILSYRKDLTWDLIINNPQINWCYYQISKNKMLFCKKLHFLKANHHHNINKENGLKHEILSTVLHPNNFQQFKSLGYNLS
jgi:hypothetical protein